MSSPSIVSQIKKKYIITRICISLVLIILAAVITYIRVPNEIKYFTARKNAFAEPCDEFKEGDFYRGHLYFIYDWFAENDEARFYLAPVNDSEGNDRILIVYIPNRFVGSAERIMTQTAEYIASNDEQSLEYDLDCRGSFYEVDARTTNYLRQFLNERGAPPSTMDQVCGKMFVMIPASSVFSERLVAWLIIDAGVLITIIVLLFTLLTKSYLKSLKNKLQKENMSFYALDKEFENPLGSFGNNLLSQYHVFEKVSPFRLMRISDVLWIYPSKTTTSNNIRIYSAVFMMRNHGCFKFPCRNESETEALCLWVLKLQPHALYGYVVENSNMYYKNFNQLLDQVYNQSSPTPTEQPVLAERPDAPLPVNEPDASSVPQQSLSPILSAETLAQSNRTEANVDLRSNVLGTGEDSVRKE